MSRLVHTEAALHQLAANSQFGIGEHTLRQVKTGATGLQIGSMPFDANQHSVHEIDPLAPLGIALDQDHVRQVLPGRPLHINVVTDITPRQESPIVTLSKQALTQDVLQAIDRALPGKTDRIFAYALTGPDQESPKRDWKRVEVSGPEMATKALARIAKTGLTIALGDFERFDAEQAGRLDSLIAVKLNHQFERQIPAGVGYISLGGSIEVNTNKAKQLSRINDDLAGRHLAVISELDRAGASIASVTADSRYPAGYEVGGTDRALATAITAKQA